MEFVRKDRLWVPDSKLCCIAPGIMPPLGAGGGGAGAPIFTTNLSMRLDASDVDSVNVYKTFTTSTNPSYSNIASAANDEIRAWTTLTPGDNGTTTPWVSATATTGPVWKWGIMAEKCILFNNTGHTIWARDGTGEKNLTGLGGNAGAKTWIISFQLVSATLNNGNIYNNHPLIMDVGQFWGLLFRKSATGPDEYRIAFYNWDGSEDKVEKVISLDTTYVVCARHDGTNLYISLNGGSETSTASGNTTTMTNKAVLGTFGTATNFRVGEILLYSTALTGTDLSDAILYMTDKWL